MIRERYELQARESSKELFLFDIMKDPRYFPISYFVCFIIYICSVYWLVY